jgi:hypothetical protein
MIFNRLVVCGDSYSEGMSDDLVAGNYRGWADRVADGLQPSHQLLPMPT